MNQTIPDNLTYTCTDGKSISIAVRKSSRAKRLSIKLREGNFTLVVPFTITEKAFHAALPQFYPWIEDRHMEALNASEAQELPSTIEIPIESKVYSIRQQSGFDQINNLTRKYLYNFVVGHCDNPRRIVYCFEEEDSLLLVGDLQHKKLCVFTLQLWAKRKANIVVVRHLRKLADELNIKISKVTIRDQRSRWGSCSGKLGQLHNISLNWRSLLLPTDLLTHLCHHELCHVLHMNHSQAFHQELQSINANAEILEEQLNNAWKKLPWWCWHMDNIK